MSAAGLPLISQLKERMHWLQSRQKLLSENVANANTPKFRPNDLKPALAGIGISLAPTITAQRHIGPLGGERGAEPAAARRFETTPSGNAVSLEDEMIKLADNHADYQAAATLYSKSLSLLKIAIGKRG